MTELGKIRKKKNENKKSKGAKSFWLYKINHSWKKNVTNPNGSGEINRWRSVKYKEKQRERRKMEK